MLVLLLPSILPASYHSNSRSFHVVRNMSYRYFLLLMLLAYSYILTVNTLPRSHLHTICPLSYSSSTSVSAFLPHIHSLPLPSDSMASRISCMIPIPSLLHIPLPFALHSISLNHLPCLSLHTSCRYLSLPLTHHTI